MDEHVGSRLKIKLAADIAIRLADGFVSPIAAKIDPGKLSEHQREMQIDYGERLNKASNYLKDEYLIQLVNDYP